MPRPKDPGRRDELAAALVDHALANGVADLSLRGAAAALGISTFPLAYHFGSRDGVVLALLDGIERRLREQVGAWAAEPGASLADVIRRAWAWCASDDLRPLFVLFFEVQALALRDPARFPGFSDRIWSPWLALLRQLARERGVPDAEADAVAWLILTAVSGGLLGLLATGDRAAADRAIDLLADRLRVGAAGPGRQERPPVNG